MDPLSILSLVEACAGLSVTAGKLAIGLKSLADSYKQSAMTFRSLSSQCKLFATSVRAIQAWMEDAPKLNTIDDRIWEQLADSLECANDAIYALESELVNTSGTSVNTFWKKANVVWNLQNMKDLEDCIYKQICSLGVILQIMNLPTRQSRSHGLQEKFSVFQASRTSAMSLRDPETSTIRGGIGANASVRAPSTMITSLSQLPQFDFDEMLLASQVYLRNRNKTLAITNWKTGAQSTRDAGTSVSQWDLPAKSNDTQAFDLQACAQYIDENRVEDAKTYIEQNWFEPHEKLLGKYLKVKRAYWDQCGQIELLQKEVEALKMHNSKTNTAVELKDQQTASKGTSLADIRELAQSRGRQIERLQEQIAGYSNTSLDIELERRQAASVRAALTDAREMVKSRGLELENLKKQVADYLDTSTAVEWEKQQAASARAALADVRELANSREREIKRLKQQIASGQN